MRPPALRCRALMWSGLLSIGRTAQAHLGDGRRRRRPHRSQAPAPRRRRATVDRRASAMTDRRDRRWPARRAIPRCCSRRSTIGSLHLAAVGSLPEVLRPLNAEARTLAESLGDPWHIAMVERARRHGHVRRRRPRRRRWQQLRSGHRRVPAARRRRHRGAVRDQLQRGRRAARRHRRRHVGDGRGARGQRRMRVPVGHHPARRAVLADRTQRRTRTIAAARPGSRRARPPAVQPGDPRPGAVRPRRRRDAGPT